MSVSCITVFVGTFYPLFYEIISGGKLSVGAPYFNATFLPLMAILFLIIAPAAMLSWKRDKIRDIMIRLWPAAIVGVAVVALALFLTWPKHVAAAFGAGLAGWTVLGVMIDLARRTAIRTSGLGGALKKLDALPRPYLGMAAAHIGIAIVAIGVLGAAVWRSEEILFLQTGEAISVGGYDIVLNQVSEREGPNFLSETAHFAVSKNGKSLRSMEAERRYYPVRGMQTTEAGIWTSLKGDLYLTLGARNESAGHAVRAWYNPFAVWLWIGGGLISFGGVIAALPRSYRGAQTLKPSALPETA